MSSPPKKDIHELINQTVQEAQNKKEQYKDDPEVQKALENVLALLSTVKSTVQKRDNTLKKIDDFKALAEEIESKPEKFFELNSKMINMADEILDETINE